MKNANLLLGFLLSFSLFTSCIKDDIVPDKVDPILRLTAGADSIGLGETFQFTARYFNNIGTETAAAVQWTSSDTDVLSIDQNGLATALAAGNSVITAAFTTEEGITVSDNTLVGVGAETIIAPVETSKSGQINTTSTYALSGDFTLTAEGDDLVLTFAENYNASTALPGLYVYVTNNPNTTAGATELGKVLTFSGAHSYTIPGAGLDDYSHVLYFCKPFNIKVGDGEIF